MNSRLNQLSCYNLPWPVNWADLFGVERPLVLEIGFGYGHYLAFLHGKFPQHSIIGLEIDNFSLAKAERAIVNKRMDNVRVIHSRAETALHHLFTPASLAQVHVNFPDPWFKGRHAGRRLMQRDTLDAIVSRLQPGGLFYLATDILPYAEMSAELLAETPGLSSELTTPWTHDRPLGVVTKYERRARQEGRDCYYFVYRRNAHPAPPVPVMEEQPMPHMVIQTPLSLDEIRDAVRLEPVAAGDIRLKFIKTYHGGDVLLFEVFVHEPTIEQRVAVVLVPRDEKPGEYTVKLSTLGTPRPTDGLHRAVRAVGEAILALHPAAQVIHDKVR
jgi:tRNA (guanine-N7-)-methyltransferase